AEAVKVLETLDLSFEMESALVGGAAWAGCRPRCRNGACRRWSPPRRWASSGPTSCASAPWRCNRCRAAMRASRAASTIPRACSARAAWACWRACTGRCCAAPRRRPRYWCSWT
ncbi:hypothetical protein C8241_03905, partial [Paracidovorax avenae]